MRKARRAWKRFPLWIGAAALTLSAMACVKPAEPAAPAMQLDMVQLMETAAMDAGNQTVAEQVRAPARCRMALDTGTDALTITVDAPVEVPDCDAMPIYRVRAADFSQRKIDSLYARLRAGTTLPADAPTLTMEETTHPQTGDVLFATPRAHASAQDAYFDTRNNSDLATYIRLNSDASFGYYSPERGAVMEFDVYREYANFAQHPAARIWDESAIPPAARGNLTATPAEAKADIERLLAGTGMVVTDIFLTDNTQFGFIDGIVADATEYAYILLCERSIGGVRCASNRGWSVQQDGNGDPAGTWWYEWAYALYTRDGLYQFCWRSPLAVLGTPVPRAKLLPFDAVMDVFAKMMLSTNPMLSADAATRNKGLYDTGAVTIDRIVLSLQRVNGTKRYDEGFLIPAWHFYGRQYYDMDTSTDDLVETGNVPPDAILTINAIDGSVVNLAAGR